MSALTPSQIEILRSITSNNTDNYWIGYQYVRSIVEDHGEYSDFVFWLGKASQINSNDIDSTANTFIRAVTRYGLIFDGYTSFDLQHNSNLIGNAVIGDLLRGGEIPPLSDIVEQDVSQAITEGHQSIAGWGGAFFYWDFELDGMTVGDRIAGDPIQFEKFITIAAKAALDTVGKHGISVTDLFEYLSISLQAQASTDIKLEIISRIASGNPNGAPDAIDLNQISEVDNTGHWMIPVAGTGFTELTDAALISTLNQLRELRTDLADNPVFNTANPDLGVVAGGGLQAMLDDSRELVAAMENVPNSVSAMLGVQTGLADLAAWYADRLTVLDLHDPSSTGVLSLDTSSAGVMEVEFSAWLKGVVQHTGLNSQGEETGLTEAQQLVPKEHALDAVYSALSPNGVAGQEEKTELDTAASIVWGNAEETGHVTATKQLEYFAFEANSGGGVSITARTSGGIDLSSALIGGSGNDLISGKDANDLLVGRSGNDELDGGNGADIIFAGEGNDTVYGGDKGDYIDGGDGNDVIYAGVRPDNIDPIPPGVVLDTGDDRILAGSGDDRVYVGSGDDLISLGDGNDDVYLTTYSTRTVIWGGAGIDSYHFAEGGHVLLVNDPNITEESFNNLDVTKLFDNLIENNPGYQYYRPTVIIFNIEKDDKIFFDDSELKTATIQEEQNNYIQDWYVQVGFTGSYTSDGLPIYTEESIQRSEASFIDRSFVFSDHPEIDISNPGTFSVWHDGVGYTLYLEGFSDGDGGINFDGDAPSVERHETIVSQSVDVSGYPVRLEYDLLHQHFVYHESYDLVGDPVTTTEAYIGENLKPEGYESQTNLTISVGDFQVDTSDEDDPDAPENPNPIFGSNGNNDIAGDADDNGIYALGGNDVVSGQDGNDYIYAGSGDDHVDGGNGADFLHGGSGNDTLIGGAGSDIYSYASGDGDDTIDDDIGAAEDFDVLELTDLNVAELIFIRSGNDLAISITATGETITVDDQFYSATEYWGLERIDFADGTSWDRGQILEAAQPDYLVTVAGTSAAETLEGTFGDDIIRGFGGSDILLGSAGSDIYIYTSGDGNDTIDDEAGFTDNTDVLVLKNLNATDLSFARYGDDLAISITATGETITVDDQFYSATEYWGLERIDFADGTSWDRGQILEAA